VSERSLEALFRRDLSELPIPEESRWLPTVQRRATPRVLSRAAFALVGIGAAALVLQVTGDKSEIAVPEYLPGAESPAPTAVATVNSGQASYAQNYGTIDELTREASVVAMVDVLRVEPFEYERIPLTMVTARVADIAKGSAPLTTVRFAFDGPPMKVGQRHIVFLTPSSGPIATGDYVLVGGVRGDFPMSSGGTIEFDARVNVDAPGNEVLRSARGRAASSILTQVRGQ
jgi:hypothetical protein